MSLNGEQQTGRVLVEGLDLQVHSPPKIISTVCDFPYKIIEKCFQ